MIIFICGASGSGKDTVANLLLEKIDKTEKLVRYVTRPRRDNEVNGVDYHFVDNQVFHDMNTHGDFVETESIETVYGTWYYGTKLDSDVSKRYVMTASFNVYKSIKDKRDDVFGVFLDVDEYTRLMRVLSRDKSNKAVREACRRIGTDYIDFKDCVSSGLFDLVVDGTMDAEHIANLIHSEVFKMPGIC